jgi:hypothetical protein
VELDARIQQQQQQQQHSLLSQASWGRLEMKPKRDDDARIQFFLFAFSPTLPVFLSSSYNFIFMCALMLARAVEWPTILKHISFSKF